MANGGGGENGNYRQWIVGVVNFGVIAAVAFSLYQIVNAEIDRTESRLTKIVELSKTARDKEIAGLRDEQIASERDVTIQIHALEAKTEELQAARTRLLTLSEIRSDAIVDMRREIEALRKSLDQLDRKITDCLPATKPVK